MIPLVEQLATTWASVDELCDRIAEFAADVAPLVNA